MVEIKGHKVPSPRNPYLELKHVSMEQSFLFVYKISTAFVR